MIFSVQLCIDHLKEENNKLKEELNEKIKHLRDGGIQETPIHHGHQAEVSWAHHRMFQAQSQSHNQQQQWAIQLSSRHYHQDKLANYSQAATTSHA